MAADPTRPLGGHPPHLTPERHDAIVADIAKALPYELAAHANGISERTFYNWLSWGKKHLEEGRDSEFSRFLQAIKRTEADRINRHIESVDKRPKNWQAESWILERRWWKHFSTNAAVVEFQKQLDRMEEEGKIADVEALKQVAKQITEK